MSKPCDFPHVLGYAAPAAKPVTSPAVVADADLLRLGAELEQLWSAEDELALRLLGDLSDAASDAMEAAINATSAVVGKIVALRATTIPGLIVKARAFSWCHRDEAVTAEDFFGPKPCSDQRLMLGIVHDLTMIRLPASMEAALRQWEGET